MHVHCHSKGASEQKKQCGDVWHGKSADKKTAGDKLGEKPWNYLRAVACVVLGEDAEEHAKIIRFAESDRGMVELNIELPEKLRRGNARGGQQPEAERAPVKARLYAVRRGRAVDADMGDGVENNGEDGKKQPDVL